MPNRDVTQIFRDYLKKLLQDSNMTQAELAKLINVSRSTVSMWISGNSLPRMELLDSIADLFGTSVSDLVKDHSKTETVQYMGLDRNMHEETGYVRQLNDNDFLKIYSIIDKENFSEEEIKEFEQYIEFIKSKRKPK